MVYLFLKWRKNLVFTLPRRIFFIIDLTQFDKLLQLSVSICQYHLLMERRCLHEKAAQAFCFQKRNCLCNEHSVLSAMRLSTDVQLPNIPDSSGSLRTEGFWQDSFSDCFLESETKVSLQIPIQLTSISIAWERSSSPVLSSINEKIMTYFQLLSGNEAWG